MNEETFRIGTDEDGRVFLAGRFDAAQVEKANQVLDRIDGPVTIDFYELQYIASAGLGALFAVQKRIGKSGGKLKFVRLKPSIWEIFRIAMFHKLIDIEEPPKESL